MKKGKRFDHNRVIWRMFNNCNFSCVYCGRRTSGPLDVLPIDKILQLLNKTLKQWCVRITGGEPFLHPDFTNICKQISAQHKIALFTNLSLKSRIQKFAENIDPKRVAQIKATTHIAELEKRGLVETFIENGNILLDKGFALDVFYVYHPLQMDKFEFYYKLFQAQGITLKLKPLNGFYKYRRYPQSYTDDQRKTIMKYKSEAFGLYPFRSKGKLCNSGKSRLLIMPDGDIVRCEGEKTLLGHVDSGVDIYKNARPCKSKFCPCAGFMQLDSLKDQEKIKTQTEKRRKLNHLFPFWK